MHDYSFTTPHGIEITRTGSEVNFRRGLWRLLHDLDKYRGIYLSSGYESAGRYSRWDIGSVNPPLEIVSYDRRVEIHPLNERGRMIAGFLAPVLAWHRIGRPGLNRAFCGTAQGDAGAVSGGTAQPAAVGVLHPAGHCRGVPAARGVAE